jgi:hypothetical protein
LAPAQGILRDEGGKTFAVVQSLGGGETIYPPGTGVSLVHGARGYVRVVPAQTRGNLSRPIQLVRAVEALFDVERSGRSGKMI